MKQIDGAALANRLGSSGCIVFAGPGNAGKVGHLCHFVDVIALDGVGVVRLESLPNHARSGIDSSVDWVTLSGSSMRPLLAAAGRSQFDGERDCDNSEGALYRATATCFVSIQLLSDKGALFAEFVLVDHVKKRELMTAEQVLRLLPKFGFLK
ncbi:MAG: hypothetical protein LH479_08485 [Polaromonas sp.]|nr:hypothetical protein [Polaromonas sp.]